MSLNPGGGAMRRLAQQSAIYVVANALVKASGLLLLPIQLNAQNLPPEHYGRLGTIAAAVGLLAPLLALGLPNGLLKFSADAQLDKRDAVPFTAWSLAFASALVGSAVLFVLAPYLGGFVIKGSEIGLGQREVTHLGRLLALYVGLEAIGFAGFNFQQVQERAFTFGGVMLTKFLLLVASQYVFLVHLNLGLQGILLSFLVASGSATVLLSAVLLARASWRFEQSLIGPLLRYGLPLVFAGLALPLLYAGDRFLLQRLVSPLSLSVYELAARIAGVLNVVLVQGFQTAFTVIGLKVLSGQTDEGLHRRTFRHFCVFASGFVLGLSLFSYDLLRFVVLTFGANAEYLDATPYIFPLSMGLFAYGLFIIGVNALFARTKTGLVARYTMLAAALNLGLNAILIPFFGAMGAALATVAAYGYLALTVLRVSQRLENFRFPWAVLVKMVAAITVLYALGQAVQQSETVARLGIRTLIMAFYPLVVLALGVYRWGEVVDGWHAVKGMRARAKKPPASA